ncbi:hypothetical protein BU24DRAFT_278552 [Aaosphaeria arxii CBS 175.79]|uniref:Uncharacterized protein n=1 Tax=Aaosphaeria arxii CBS 175.79 TaxID=1450172 RepID=A0A6A5XEL3_9PLEO|nr:uncharacterized protein BU24DRAFT_278552 [Aaosphaeria arxii CBS 175.79]KAF2011319.1 hypothetical protein BU24DRAFT_278552 [Aaosphaeria arxii CBS 175.79]
MFIFACVQVCIYTQLPPAYIRKSIHYPLPSLPLPNPHKSMQKKTETPTPTTTV